jgi:hypothetical protein
MLQWNSLDTKLPKLTHTSSRCLIVLKVDIGLSSPWITMKACRLGQYRLKLDRGWCECRKFQTFRMPCSHVIAACSKVRRDPSYLLSDVYKVISISNLYKISFSVVAKEDYWPEYQGDILWHNEIMRRKKKGRLNSTHIRIEMNMVNKMVRLCTSCRQLGHNRTTCPNVGTNTTR